MTHRAKGRRVDRTQFGIDRVDFQQVKEAIGQRPDRPAAADSDIGMDIGMDIGIGRRGGVRGSAPFRMVRCSMVVRRGAALMGARSRLRRIGEKVERL
ncbi:hypothetical protein [Sphingobium sp. Leaf26]|uniref:hypothetical protein n=1 Tax=Sphingobium sp. Leaf26 TaxID=1735693 RepID=UPI000A58423E|nr:hypothetical protein [Sphingobium sp. Leaf26]